jgi:hypothetical protein
MTMQDVLTHSTFPSWYDNPSTNEGIKRKCFFGSRIRLTGWSRVRFSYRASEVFTVSRADCEHEIIAHGMYTSEPPQLFSASSVCPVEYPSSSYRVEPGICTPLLL